MCDNFNKSVLKLSVAQICLSMGWHSMQKSTHAILTDVLERYLGKLTKTTASYCENFSRTIPNVNDVSLAFNEMGIPLDELKDYVTQVEAVEAFRDKIHPYPIQKSTSLIIDQPSQQELLSRDEHYDDHFPALTKTFESEKETDSMEVDAPVTASIVEEQIEPENPIKERVVSPLKIPLIRKRSACSPPYSPIEPKRLNIDADYTADLTRPDLKVSTPIGLAPIITTAEVTTSSTASSITTDNKERLQPQAITSLPPSEIKPEIKPEKKSLPQLLSPTRTKIKSPLKKLHTVIATKQPTPNTSTVQKLDMEKKSLTLDLPKSPDIKLKLSPKSKSPDKKLLSPKNKLASPANKTLLKQSISTKPMKATADLSFRPESPMKQIFSPKKDIDSSKPMETIPLPKKLSPKPRKELPPLTSPESKSKLTPKHPELMSPPEAHKSIKVKSSSKIKKKKSTKEAPAVTMTNLLFSNPLQMVSTPKKQSPSDNSEHSTKTSFKSPSRMKSPPVKTEKESTHATSVPKKKKKKTKDKDRERDTNSTKSTSTIVSEKKIKKEKVKDETGKSIPKLTLKMDISSVEADARQTPKLIIKTESSPPPKTAKPSTSASTISRAPTLPTSSKTEKIDDTKPRGVFMETLTTTLNPVNTDLYYCPTCSLPDNGSPMIGCDVCDQWFHWPCVSIFVAPKDDELWFCPNCAQKQTKKKKKKKKKDD